MNGSLRGHRAIAEELGDFQTMWAVPIFALATISLWFLDRPGSGYRWRTACVSALTAAGLGLVAGQVLTHLWARERPYVAHPGETLLFVPPSHEPSFPSDHAIAAFGIAFAVAFLGGRLAGAIFLAGATTIAISRVFVGLHYPGDVAAGMLIGLASAALVAWSVSPRIEPIVRLAGRVTDPLVTPAWRALDAHRRARAR